MSSLPEPIETVEQRLKNHFDLLGDWTERYTYLIELGQQLPPFPKQYQTDAYKVKGCLSQVWMHVEMRDDRLHFQAISDAAIVSGLIAILMMIYNHRFPRDILTLSPTFIKTLGLDQHLSPTRSNGLHALLTHIQSYAKHYAEGVV